MKKIIIILIVSIVFAISYMILLAAVPLTPNTTNEISSSDIFLFLAVVPIFFGLVLTILFTVLIVRPKMKTAKKQFTARKQTINASKVYMVKDEFVGESVLQKKRI